MRKQALSFFFFIMMNLAMMAQDDFQSGGKFVAKVEANLAGRDVEVRSKPCADAAIIATLSIGTPVYLIEDSETLQNPDYHTPAWYKVRFTYNDAPHTGYVWASAISLETHSGDGEEEMKDMLIYGLSSWDRNNGFNASARIINKGQLFGSFNLKPFTESFNRPKELKHSTYIRVTGREEFPGIRNVISVNYDYEAGRQEEGEVFLWWDGKKLLHPGHVVRVHEPLPLSVHPN